MWWHGDWSWGAWFAMSTTMLFFWVLVIWVVFTLVRGMAAKPDHASAEDVLAERFARGEIDEEEFRKRRELLRSGS